jgi:carboxypeptidase Taq
MIEGTLSPDELPAAWNEGMMRLLGVEVPRDADGVLQDIHWSGGLFGYFPTYAFGNLISAQLWEAMEREIPDLDDAIERGDFGVIREWLGENIHRHGSKFTVSEHLMRLTGQDLSAEPFLKYLKHKLKDTGLLKSGAAAG